VKRMLASFLGKLRAARCPLPARAPTFEHRAPGDDPAAFVLEPAAM